MSLEAWLAFCLLETVLSFTPGPAVLFVFSVSLARGARAGLGASFGILLANTLYFALSATGIAALILASGRLFDALRWLGAAYLVWLGLPMLLGRGIEPTPRVPHVAHGALLRGILVQGANPKALVYFVAVLPQFIEASRPVAGQLLVLGISSVAIELCVLVLYVQFAVRAQRLAGAHLARTLERLGGGLLVAAGAQLALMRAG